MSQRRNANSKAPVVAEAVITGPLSLEATPNSIAEETVSLTAVPEEGPSLRVKKWKESPFAVGLTEPTWEAQRLAGKYKEDEEGDDDYLPNPDSSGCLCCSALICPLVGAGRVGNMAVLHSSVEWVEEVEEDEETGETKTRRYSRPKLNWVVGPFWPFLIFVTYPLIFGVSGWAFTVAILPGKKHPMLVLGWLVITLALIVALSLTGCRDPGIMYRHPRPPPQNENQWRWNDQAQTFRPRLAYYDSDTAVMVEEFDHTCPWTGTAIGKGNMFPFQCFVCLVFVCLVVDIFLITGAV